MPNGAEILDQKGWIGFLEHYLGEGQFGPDRYNLSASKRLYYQLKPFLPRSAVRLVRKGYRQFQEDGFLLGWPIEDRFVKFLKQMFMTISKLAINNDQLSMVWSDEEKSKLSTINDQLSTVVSHSERRPLPLNDNCQLLFVHFIGRLIKTLPSFSPTMLKQKTVCPM